MSRIKIDLPKEFNFHSSIPVRITDINYGGHMGNDSILSLIHEARMQFLASFGFSELDLAGVGMIMADVSIEFRNESFYGDTIIVSVAAVQVSKMSFDLYYKLETAVNDNRKLIAAAKTGMVCYNYGLKKIAFIPEQAQKIFKGAQR